MRNDYVVCEIFASIEGEGKRTGYPATFVRFTGCNLRCGYCDTKYALTEGTNMTKEEIVKKVQSYPWKRVTLTGGEPLLQKNIQDLASTLSDLGYEINVETNGAVKPLRIKPKNLFYTMDWKCKSSGETDKMIKTNLRKLTERDVLKFVVGNTEDLEQMSEVLKEVKRPLVYVSPVFGKIKPSEIVEYVKQNNLGEVCVQVQLHKIIYDPSERGV